MNPHEVARSQRLDVMERLGLESALEDAFVDAFEALTGGRTRETRAHVWRHLRIFSRYMREAQISIPLPGDVLLRFKHQLMMLDYTPRYMARIHQTCLRVLKWIERNTSGLIKRLQNDKSARLCQRKHQVVPSNLQSSDVKAILRAAYTEIDEIEARIASNWRRIDNETHELTQLIGEVLRDGRKPPFKKQTELNGALHRRVQKCGGLRAIRAMLFPTPADIFPFYIAILCQCSANPMSLRHLRRSCISSHPLRSDRERITWDKPRAGYEQKADFSVKKPRSAPNLIRRLISLNSSLAAVLEGGAKEQLFLAYGNSGIAVPSWQSMHDLHQAFIVRNQLKPHFLKDFRKAGAELHAIAAGTILRATARLNHRSARTTGLYVSPGILGELHDDRIAMHQSRLHELVSSATVMPANETLPALSGKAETVFGFTCKDPWAGIQDGQRGKRCLKFTGCATCPGAIVTLDDPNVVARMLKAVMQLTDAKQRATKEGWLDRYNVLYESTRIIIEEELMPKVSQPILDRANGLIDQHRILFLE